MKARLLAVMVALVGAASASADLAEVKKAGVLRVLAVEANTPNPWSFDFLRTIRGSDTKTDDNALRGASHLAGGCSNEVTSLQLAISVQR